MNKPMHHLLFGHGYLGSRVASHWRDRGDEVTIVTRSDEKASQLTAVGYKTIVAHVTQRASLAKLPQVDSVLYAVGYDRTAGPSIHEVYADGLRNVLDALPIETGRIVYVSTTGVYGDAGGNIVDEETPPAPTRDGGRASLAAEETLRQHRLGDRGIILRLAGIYGPDRIPFLDPIRAGDAIPATASGFLNLIHVNDAAPIAVRAAEANVPNLPRAYCVSDGRPVVREEYYGEIARLLGAVPPRFFDPPPDSPRALRAASDRRVKNDRMIRELEIVLQYPSYREGLAAILG
jgi:nucleoside-diphosphate-sugar epimerase